MGMKCFAFVLALLVASVAQANEYEPNYGSTGIYQGEFVLNCSYDTVVKWATENRNELIESTRVEILNRNGKTLKLRKSSIKGVYEFITEEEVSENKNSCVTTYKLVSSVVGDLVKQDTTVIFERLKNNRTLVKFDMYSEVESSVNSRLLMQLDVAASFTNFKSTLERTFGESADYEEDIEEQVVKTSTPEPVVVVKEKNYNLKMISIVLIILFISIALWNKYHKSWY